MFVESVRDMVAGLLAEGLSQPEIARKLGVAPSTVEYHVRRLIEQAKAPPKAPPTDCRKRRGMPAGDPR
jgi:IS30 family transposase